MQNEAGESQNEAGESQNEAVESQNEAVKWHLLPLAVGEGRSALRRWAKSLTGSAFSLHGVDVLPTRGRRPPYTGETGSLHGAAASSPCAGVGRQRFNSDARKMAFTRPFGLPSESFAFCGTFPFRLLSAAHESNCCFVVRSIERSGRQVAASKCGGGLLAAPTCPPSCPP